MTGRPGRDHHSPLAGPAPDAGMVTAEFAVALPALVLVLVLALSAVAGVTAQMRCADAAEVAARLAARGEPRSAVLAAGRAAAPADATLAVDATSGDTVTVAVSAVLRLPGLGRWLPAVRIRERFTEPREPGPSGSGPAP